MPALRAITPRCGARIALVAVVLGASSAPLAAAGVRLPCAFEPGDAVAYRVERAREDVRSGRTTGGRGAYDVAIEVTAREADGYLLRWRQKVAAVEPGAPIPPAAQAEVDALVAAANDLELVIRTDAALSPRALANEAEVRTALEAALDRLQTLGRDPPEVREGARRLLATPGAVTSLALREPSLLLMLACADLAEDRAEFEDHLPNPFGGPPLPSRAAVTVLSPGDQAAGTPARLAFEQRLDPAGLRAFLEDFARRAAPPGRGFPPGAPPSFEIKDEATVDIDVADGWPMRVDWRRRVAAAEARRTDSLAFTRAGRR